MIRLAVVLLVTIAGSLATIAVASAQTDPYTGGGPTSPQARRPGMSINKTEAAVDEDVRLQGCGFGSNALVRITLNPGTTQNPGVACPGAIGTPAGAPAPNPNPNPSCRYDNPGRAVAPGSTAGGAIGDTTADANGCVDTFVRIPNRPAGTYELCTVSAGSETLCAVLRIKAASGLGTVFDDPPANTPGGVLGNTGGANSSVGGDGVTAGGSSVKGDSSVRGFARTGMLVLPLLLLAVLAILVGRWLMKRSRREATA